MDRMDLFRMMVREIEERDGKVEEECPHDSKDEFDGVVVCLDCGEELTGRHRVMFLKAKKERREKAIKEAKKAARKPRKKKS